MGNASHVIHDKAFAAPAHRPMSRLPIRFGRRVVDPTTENRYEKTS
jgi:hypothetical protein